jgi:hypothetical protein
MSIQYEFTFNFNCEDEDFRNFLTSLPHFHKYDSKNNGYIYKTSDRKNPDAVIEILDSGIRLRDYLTGVGRELIGFLVEHITGITDNLIIEEADRYLY